MPRKPNTSPLWRLIELTIPLWEKAYDGEKYLPTGKDFKYGKEYLDINGEDFQADEIVRRYQIFICSDRVYADRRHQFCDFIRNIGSFVPAKREKYKEPQKYQCPDCLVVMNMTQRENHVCSREVQPFTPEIKQLVDDTLAILKGKK